MTQDSIRPVVYSLLTVATVSMAVARIANVELVFEPSIHRAQGDQSPTAPSREWPTTRPNPMPTFSSNDRSRWCTVRALVDHGTWIIGHRDADPGDATKYVDRGIVFEDGWKTVDKVLNPDTLDYYSSKPPLLSVLAAGEYWLLKQLFGWSIVDDPNKVIKTIVVTFNALPLLFYLVMLRRLVDQFGVTDWGRLFVFVAACFGTFITTFATTLNNHTLAAVTALAAVYPFLTHASEDASWLGRIAVPPLPSTARLLAAGALAGLVACLELPALALLVLLGLGIACRSWKGAVAFLAAGFVVFGLESVLNSISIGDWLPAYGKLGGPWYEYPGSHWLRPPGQIRHGIDFARQHESWGAYVFHCLIGHHGLFSLTPIWVLSFAAMIRSAIALARRPAASAIRAGHGIPAFLAPFALLISLTIIGFYLATTTNYGGWTSGLRWLIWLTPLWLLTLLPAADRLADSRRGRGMAYVLLAVSIFSASFPIANPWRHPWLYRFMEAENWVPY